MLTQSLIASKINLYQDETSKNINIDNFELPDFEDSKYVLTSPRSLIACENLGIKPSDILPKTFSEVYSQIGRERFSLPIAYRIFSKQEIERKVRIARIKLERYCIIKNDQGLVTSKSSFSIKQPLLMSNTFKSLDFNNQSVASSNKISNSKYFLNEDKLENRLKKIENRISILQDKELEILQPYLNLRMDNLKSSGQISNSTNLTKGNSSPANSSNFMSFKEENYSKSTENHKHETVQSSFLENRQLTLQKQNEFEANLTKTLINSKKINEETEIYYRNKLSKRLELMEIAKQKRENILNEKRLQLSQKHHEKFRSLSGNLNKIHKIELMKSLHDLSKIKQKEAIVKSKIDS